MEKLLVVSALKDDCYQKNAAHFLEKHLEDVKSGAEKFAMPRLLRLANTEDR